MNVQVGFQVLSGFLLFFPLGRMGGGGDGVVKHLIG